MIVLNIAVYRFIPLDDLRRLRSTPQARAA
jgi:hypothetical protein